MTLRALLFPALLAAVPCSAQATRLPRSVADLRTWNMGIVKRAEAMLDAPARWKRSDSAACRHADSSFTLRCALELASDEVAGVGGASPRPGGTAVDCALPRSAGHAEGSCGVLFDEASVFSIASAKSIATGVWRRDAAPTEVWSGRMINPGAPALTAARRLVDSIAPGKYRNARLDEFNSDSTVTFADLQAYFHALEARIAVLSDADLTAGSDDVEIEVYAGGRGVMRTYRGWFPLNAYSATDAEVRFRVDTTAEVPPNAVDAEIIRRADRLLASDAVWNRADNRKCPAGATTWSIYCALEHATREVSGGFHHRRPALETVRLIVEDWTKDRNYDHRLMDYNNDRSTTLADVHRLFAAALAKTPQ